MAILYTTSTNTNHITLLVFIITLLPKIGEELVPSNVLYGDRTDESDGKDEEDDDNEVVSVTKVVPGKLIRCRFLLPILLMYEMSVNDQFIMVFIAINSKL